jgi:hypothetical protein
MAWQLQLCKADKGSLFLSVIVLHANMNATIADAVLAGLSNVLNESTKVKGTAVYLERTKTEQL